MEIQMQRSAHHHRTDFDSRLTKIMSVLSFRRRAQAAKRKQAADTHAASNAWAQTFWGRKFMKSASLMLALFCSASIALADIKITTKSAAGGQSINSTTYVKGARQRTEGMGYTMIYQCDLKRMIQLNDKTKTYLITPLGNQEKSKGSHAPNAGSGGARRGGVVTYTTTTTDTGERKELHGLTARHLKSTTVIEASEGACNPMNMEMEVDGWYVDLPGGLSCATDESATPQYPVEQSDCVDEVRFKTAGTAKLGHPVLTTTKMTFKSSGDGPAMNIPASTSTQEVVEFSKAALDAALFEIPAGYREVKSVQELGSPY
jgi:hypothetical protein